MQDSQYKQKNFDNLSDVHYFGVKTVIFHKIIPQLEILCYNSGVYSGRGRERPLRM